MDVDVPLPQAMLRLPTVMKIKPIRAKLRFYFMLFRCATSTKIVVQEKKICENPSYLRYPRAKPYS